MILPQAYKTHFQLLDEEQCVGNELREIPLNRSRSQGAGRAKEEYFIAEGDGADF